MLFLFSVCICLLYLTARLLTYYLSPDSGGPDSGGSRRRALASLPARPYQPGSPLPIRTAKLSRFEPG
eukprot:scaffold41331_cov65-Phaeocystis_antarctica.AAC.8